MEFLGLGISELFVIILLGLIFIKPEELPSLIRKIVKGIQQFRQISMNVRNDLTRFYEDEISTHIEEGRQQIRESIEKVEQKVIDIAAVEKDTEDSKNNKE